MSEAQLAESVAGLRSAPRFPPYARAIETNKRKTSSGGQIMQVHCARLFTDEDGASRFEDLTVKLEPGFSTARLKATAFSAPFLACDGSLWLGLPAGWVGDTPHPAPRRMIFVTTQGEYQITTSEGETRRFPAGAVLLIEDTAGAGHSSRVTSTENLIIFAVSLPPK